MQFAEQRQGDYRIYGGAVESPWGGYLAAVVVMKTMVGAQPALVFRDERLSGGHRFAAATDAVRHAMASGRRALRACQAAR